MAKIYNITKVHSLKAARADLLEVTCAQRSKLAFFFLWSGASTLSRHARKCFFFPGLDGGSSTLIPKISLIARWVYFCKPLECVCRCCSRERINEIAISQSNSNDFDRCIGFCWLFILDSVDALTHATTSMYEKPAIVHFEDFGLTVCFPIIWSTISAPPLVKS